MLNEPIVHSVALGSPNLWLLAACEQAYHCYTT